MDGPQLEHYFEFVEPNDTRIKGHRIGIESTFSKYLEGQTLEQIAQQCDTLRLLAIYAIITYYLQNKAATEAHLKRTKQMSAEDMAHSDATPRPSASVYANCALGEVLCCALAVPILKEL